MHARWLKRALLAAALTGGSLIIGGGVASANTLSDTVDGAGIVQDQSASNTNSTEQNADSTAETKQLNVNAPVSILSSGSNNGDVDQSNDAHTTAAAGNANSTEQGVQQDQDASSDGAGSGSSCDPCGEDRNGGDIDQKQDGHNSNTTEQNASAQAGTEQTNVNAPVSVLSTGSNGSSCGSCGSDSGGVDQNNDANTKAESYNDNATDQSIEQGQLASIDDANPCDHCSGSAGDIVQSQEGGNENTTDQGADAKAETHQVNINAPVSILSSGSNNGDVDQSNEADTKATSYNGNATDQSVDQGQTAQTGGGGDHGYGCGCHDGYNGKGSGSGDIDQTQDATNANSTTQDATSEATTNQYNVNAPVSILSVGSNNGDVHQGNDAHTNAAAGNSNSTEQSIGQQQWAAISGGHGSPCDPCGDRGGGSISQEQNGSNENATGQDASATATTEQTNWNTPVSILSVGGNGSPCGCGGSGDVDQSNDANTKAESYNSNVTGQWIGQKQQASIHGGKGGGYDKGYGDGCGCHEGDHGSGDITQTQDGSNANDTKQYADSKAETKQENKNLPVLVPVGRIERR